MKLLVGINKITIDEKSKLNAGEYNVHEVEFEFDEVYNGLITKAVFEGNGHSYLIDIVNNKCTIPYEVLSEKGDITIGAYGYNIDGNNLVLRYSPSPIYTYVDLGSYRDSYDNYQQPTADIIEQLTNRIETTESRINEALEEVEEYNDRITTNTNNIDDLNNNKVDKVEGKDLSTNDFTNEYKDKVDNAIVYDDTEIRQEIANLDSSKVDKVQGKNLSTNDYTNEEKSKLANLSNYDDTQIQSAIASLQTNKANVSDIPDISNFITSSVDNLVNYYKKSETYTQSEVNNLIGAIQQFHYEIVQTLPQTGANNILYLVPKTTTETQNVYDEYVYANNSWEKIGDTQIDLSGYVTITMLNNALANYTTTNDLTTLLNGKVDKIEGKGLSTNDLTNELLASLQSGKTEVLEINSDLQIWTLSSGTYIIRNVGSANVKIYYGSYNNITISKTTRNEIYLKIFNDGIRSFVSYVPYMVAQTSMNLTGDTTIFNRAFLITGEVNATGTPYSITTRQVGVGFGASIPIGTNITRDNSYNLQVVPKATPTNNTDLIGKRYFDTAVNTKTYELSGLSAYSSSSTYNVDDYVYYNNLIYKCNTAVDTAEAFDSTKWTQKTYMEYMNDMLIGTALGGSY